MAGLSEAMRPYSRQAKGGMFSGDAAFRKVNL